MADVLLDTGRFEQVLGQFRRDMQEAANGRPFGTLRDGLAGAWENYKEPLRAEALKRLGRPGWSAADVGSGTILDAVVRAIEISNPGGGLTNNLVRWPNRFGHANRSHSALLDARGNSQARRRLESLLFDLYEAGEPAYGHLFEALRGEVGDRYDLLAYLFFLRDWDRFMPIATMTFDRAFAALGIDVVTTQRCSWENYQAYNASLSAVRTALSAHDELGPIRLIDAHSFCWLLIRVPMELLDGDGLARRGERHASAIVYDARMKSIWEMAYNTEQTARNANGQVVQRIVKPKELRMTRQALEALLDRLLETQEERCALTGLRLHYRAQGADDALLPSLDRIDSNGHYEEGNLQVVCRFVNFWKGDTPNEEFKRLLALVRGDEF